MKSKAIISIFSLFIGLLIWHDGAAQRTTTGTRGGNSTELEKPTGRKIFGSDKWFIGGNVGANFNGNFGYIELSPILGYNVTKSLALGAGPVYQYVSSNGNSFNTYGVRGLARQELFAEAFEDIAIIRGVFLQGEFANLTVRANGDKLCSYRRLPVGAGVRLSGNRRSYFYGAALYDLFYNADGGVSSADCPILDDRGNPWVFRLGFQVGI